MQQLKKILTFMKDYKNNEALYEPLKRELLNPYQTSSAWPEEHQKGLIRTLNQRGPVCTFLNPGQRAFIQFAKNAPLPLVDIDCSFGIATRPAIANGATVIAIDNCAEHLAILERSLPNLWRKRLTSVNQSFPTEVTLTDNSVSAILASHVLQFLMPEILEKALEKCYHWLTPGGLFWSSQNALNHYTFSGLRDNYIERKTAGEKWPGLTPNFHNYVEESWRPYYPTCINFMEIEEIHQLLLKTGFEIVEQTHYIHPYFKHFNPDTDKKSSYYILARKP